MKKSAFFLACLFTLFSSFIDSKLPSFMLEHQEDLGEFFAFFQTGIDLFQEREGKRIVETPSCIHPDLIQNLQEGNGTLIFSALAEEEEVLFHPFAKTPSKRKKLFKTCRALFPATHTSSPSRSLIDTMKHFTHSIDLLFLQSIKDASANSIRPRYQLFQELVAIFPHLSDTAVIMLNDHMVGRSSSKLFIRYLSAKGWTPVYESPVGLIFVKSS
jgi:hypothetical protein